MFSFLTCKLPIEPSMLQYMKEETNESLKRRSTDNSISTPPSVSMYYYVPFLSLFSFLAGYHFSHIMKTLNK